MRSHSNRSLTAVSTTFLGIFAATLIFLTPNGRRRVLGGGAPLRLDQTAPATTMSMPAMPMALVAPLFVEDTESTSTITMVNSIPGPLDVDVILFDLYGNQLAKHTTTIGASAAQQIMVRDILDDASYAGSAYGSAVLVPHRMFPLAAQMSIVRGSEALNDIEEEFMMLMEEPGPSNFRAVASDVAGAPVISVRSLSGTTQPISIECMDDAGRHRTSNLSIQPNETLLVQACLDGGAYPIPSLDDSNLSNLMADAHHGSVAVSVSSPAPPKELVVFGLGIEAKDPVRMRAMTFTDISALRSSTAIYPGMVAEGSLLGLRKPRLKLSIANFGQSPRNATFYLTAGSGDTSTEQAVATVNIPAGGVAVRNLDPEASSDDVTLDRSLVVQADAEIGEILSDVQLLSSSPDSPLSVPLPWKDHAQPYNGAQHPWRIDGPFSSTVLLFNPDPHEANSVVLSIFAGDKRWNKLIPLPSLATTAVSLNDVVAKQQPDEKGRKLPRTSTSGIVSWFTLTNPKIFGQLVQVNATERIARPFACPTATILCGATVDDLSLNVGQQNSTNAHSITCGTCAPCLCTLGGCNVVDGSPDGGLTANNVTWGAPNSPNASIAKILSSNVNNGIISAIFQGVSPGTTTSSVVLTDMYGCSARNNLNDTSQGQITVAPSLTLQGGSDGIFVGTDPNLSTPNSIFATVSPSGGTFTETSSASSDTFTPVTAGGPGWAVSTTTQSAGSGDRTLTVTYTVNSQQASQSLHVTARQFAYATNNSPSNTCTLGFGTKYLFTYTPYTHPDHAAAQPGIGLSNTAVTESFNPQPPSGAGTGNGNLDANSQFADRIEYCSTGTLTALPDVTQKLFIEGYQVRQNLLTYSSSGVSLANQGPTQ